jgi:hypothetical protein
MRRSCKNNQRRPVHADDYLMIDWFPVLLMLFKL